MPTSTTPNTSAPEAFPRLSAEEIEARLIALNNSGGGSSARDERPYRLPLRRFAAKSQSAAVLLPLLTIAEEWHLLYIHRSDVKGDAHSGQVAFPGGRCEENETFAQAALREACEEVGLLPQDVRLLGSLKPMHSVTNFSVTPLVGVIPWPYPLRIQAQEVSRAFTIPLRWLANPANRREKPYFLFSLLTALKVIYFQPYDGETLWGLSARITLDFLDVYLG